MPPETDIRNKLMSLLQEKLQRLSIRESEINDKFDLVKSGLVNSLEFVDIVASIEKAVNIEIDFEQALDKGDLTTVGGLVRAFIGKA